MLGFRVKGLGGLGFCEALRRRLNGFRKGRLLFVHKGLFTGFVQGFCQGLDNGFIRVL